MHQARHLLVHRVSHCAMIAHILCQPTFAHVRTASHSARMLWSIRWDAPGQPQQSIWLPVRRIGHDFCKKRRISKTLALLYVSEIIERMSVPVESYGCTLHSNWTGGKSLCLDALTAACVHHGSSQGAKGKSIS